MIYCALSLLSACVTTSNVADKASLSRAAVYNAQLGAGYLSQGNFLLAKQKLDKALEQNPDLPEAHSTYGVLEGQLGKAASAEKHFRTALKLEPHNSEFLNNYGTFLCNQNRVKEAEEKFMAALNDPLYTTPEYAYTNAGACAMRVSDYDTAEAYIRKAMQVNPNFPNALFEMSRLNMLQKKYTLAKSYLDRYHEVIGLNGHTPETLWYAIELSKILKDNNAVASYSLLLKSRFPDSSQAQSLK